MPQIADPGSDLSRKFDQEHAAHFYEKILELAQKELPLEKWRLFHQLVLEGTTPDEVAARNGVSINVIYLAKSRVLNWLREVGCGLIDEDYP